MKYDVIGLAEIRRRYSFNAVYDTGAEVFLGTCDSRGVDGVGVRINTKWNNSRFDNLRRLRADIKLRRKKSRSVLNGLGEV
ncbi:unnamed protein product [Angiostrongylus costaricensis]|uniref:Peptidase A1 domain-containing protein n=1 Tax=Angiostrongylus costaricensis TaxID=334426 RepID=A0A0R3PHU5_ANGCS|nr:unnamed protein product [Angiostrongylus costaricensis]